MSCLRRDDAFSICSSSAKASSSAGVFRLSSWRFMDVRVALRDDGSSAGGLRGQNPAAAGRLRGLSEKCERKPAGGYDGSLTERRYASQTRLQELGCSYRAPPLKTASARPIRRSRSS